MPVSQRLTALVTTFVHRQRIRTGICLLVALFSMGVAQAQQLDVTQDTFVSGFPSQVNDNKGGLSILTVADSGPRIAFVEFDLSGQAGIVTSALLTLNVRTVNTPGTVDLHVVQGAWDENTMTYVNRPGSDPVAYSVAVAGADANGSVSLDITDLAQGWINDANANHGLALVSNGAKVNFGTKEGSAGATLDLEVAAGIAISSVIVSPTQLSIQGENFDNGDPPQVTLGDIGPLNVAQSTGAMILADLPGQPGAGDYLLTVTTGANPGQSITYDLTLGALGLQGDQGPQGKIGPQGDPGADGAQGVQGKIGPAGDQGVQGKLGPMGSQGPQGKIGPAGEDGAQGAQGKIGPQGVQGKVGPAGADGAGGLMDEHADVTVTTAANNDLLAYDTATSEWINLTASEVGLAGPQGDQGPQGKIGPAGSDGSQGVQGKIGPQGDQGPQGKIGPAGNDGSQGVQGKIGPQGDQGPQGKIGPQGDPGADSTVPGPQGPQGDPGVVSFATDNTRGGTNALASNTTGFENTAYGVDALASNTTGGLNTASGYNALGSNTTGDSNTASGNGALQENTTGINNTAVGYKALRDNNGNENTAVGYSALTTNTTGSRNTASGLNALRANTAGNDNTAIGYYTLGANTTGSSNTASGVRALYRNTTGYGNTASGYQALQLNTTGANNTASGYLALRDNTTGNYNTAGGNRALLENTTGEKNTATGNSTLLSNTTGYFNTATGTNALQQNTTGFNNTASGALALQQNTTGLNNTALGHGALGGNVGGNYNIAIGYNAGIAMSPSNSDNIIIGNSGSTTDAGVIRIGSNGVQTKTFIEGIRGITTGVANAVTVFIDSTGQLGTVSSSRRYKEDINEMAMASEPLLNLRPVTFRYKERYDNGEKPIQYGLIAEEVAEQFPDLVVYNEEGQAETVKYQLLSVLLLNELQKQQGEVAELKAQAGEVAELKAQAGEVAELKAQVEELNKLVGQMAQFNEPVIVATNTTD